MRRELIEALTYPRLLILKIIDAQVCEHDSLFEATSARCHQCSMGRECHWVSCLNDFEDPQPLEAGTTDMGGGGGSAGTSGGLCGLGLLWPIALGIPLVRLLSGRRRACRSH